MHPLRNALQQALADQPELLKLAEDYERYYQLVHQATGIGVWDWRLDTGMILWDDPCWEMLGEAPSTQPLSYVDWQQRVHPEDLARVEPIVQQQLQSGQPFIIEFRFRHHQGHWLWVEGRGQVVEKSEDGSPLHMMGTHTNIHQRKQAELALVAQKEALAHSNQLLEEFAYAASHDLRQPLRMIHSYLQLLEKGLEGQLSDKNQQMLTFALSGADRLDSLINALLEYSRVGRKGPPNENYLLRESLEEALSFLAPDIERTQAQIDIVPGPWPHLNACRDEMTRLLMNLISNALKYTQPGQPPRVQIRLSTSEQDWVIEVCDQGIGIAEHNLDRVFRVFQRLHPASAYEGSGIGLAICRKIVERHGGKIQVSSEGENQGTCFKLTLPRHLDASRSG